MWRRERIERNEILVHKIKRRSTTCDDPSADSARNYPNKHKRKGIECLLLFGCTFCIKYSLSMEERFHCQTLKNTWICSHMERTYCRLNYNFWALNCVIPCDVTVRSHRIEPFQSPVGASKRPDLFISSSNVSSLQQKSLLRSTTRLISTKPFYLRSSS